MIMIPYPGASPETVEREIVNRIEKSLQSIPGVNEVNVDANEGSAQFWLEFGFDKNLIEASDEVRNAIAAVRYKLPIEMREPILQRFDPASQPIMNMALSSSTPEPRGNFAPGRGRAGRPLPRHRRRGHGQRQRRPAARAVGAAARRKAA